MTDQRQDMSGGDEEGSIPCPFRDGGARGWDAWLNAMPGPDSKTLIVIGEVNTEAGYAGKLELTFIDRAMPPNQHAELTLVESPGAPGGWQPIRADQETDQTKFNSVIVHCHDEELVTISPVPVVV
jgi:hypothetical protein